MKLSAMLLLAGWVAMSAAAPSRLLQRRMCVAHVLDVKGSASLIDDQGEERPAQLFGAVYEGDRVVLGAKSLVVLGFRANRQMVRLQSPGEFAVNKTGVDTSSGAIIVEVPAKHRPLVSRLLGELPPATRAGTSVVRSGNPSRPAADDRPNSDGLSPIDRSTVMTGEPTLRWPPAQHAVAYEVVVSYSDGDSAWSATTRATSVECRAERCLKSGARCRWEVTAELSDGTFRRVYAGAFSVASEEQSAAAAQVVQLAADADTPCLTLAAMWCLERGFLTAATDIAERLVEASTGDLSAQELLHQLYVRAGRRDDARRVWRRIAEASASGPTPTAPKP